MSGGSRVSISRVWQHCCGRRRGVHEVETLFAADLRPGREAERWLNTLLRRTE